MRQGSPRGRLGRWWFLILPSVPAFVALAALLLACDGARQAPDPMTVQVHCRSWHVGSKVELTLQSDLPQAGQAISITLLSPGSGLPQIEGRTPEFFGLSGVQIPWLLPEYQPLELALARAAGAQVIGLDFEWRRIEPQPGQYIWHDTDTAVALARENGLRLAPMLLYTPHWASTAPFAPLDSHLAPPADYDRYRDFVYAVVSRYKPYGTSSLTANGYGITDWAIWNEPNMRSEGEAPEPGTFWTGSLQEYLLMLRAGYEGAHAADPACNVLNGALADVPWEESDLYLPWALERLYDPDSDGNAGDGARPFFDTLNIHTYQTGKPTAAWYEDRLGAILKVMERFGDGQKAIWITETGYGSLSVPETTSEFVDEQTQAEAVRLVYVTTANYPQVQRVFWWSLRDYYSNGSAANVAMEAHYGLLRATFEPKPAYLAYGQLTGHLGQVLTMAGNMDDEGKVQVQIPASFVSQPGEYVVLAAREGMTPMVVVTCEATADEGEG